MEKPTADGEAHAAQLPYIIIGSGTAGLALAQGLRKANIPCVVFEKNAATHGERDWNMGLHWGAPVLKSLMPDGWWDRIQSVQVDPNVPTKEQDTLKWLRGDTGALVAAITFGPFYRLRRSKLRDLLMQGLDIHFDKRLHDVSYSPLFQLSTVIRKKYYYILGSSYIIAFAC
ncbi:uncharacterized protein J4E92_007577 [Alternaria infectoria]|uniref:uncharacterized protein n=1 Tax=Alternaria infectoria TaxID=45303 RepID=UPI00221EEC8D|nr:uncharacterized protein J4E92_007577 [Alternaria infectoria]KAI4923603.1 hypothetical protein J4E92_007577 [Alternaria infectoria]